MNIQLFTNKKGLIYGGDQKRITCDTSGLLKIGNTEITVNAEDENIMPLLFYGASGDYDARYIVGHDVYVLERVAVRNGRILPPPSTALELMELHIRADTAERERNDMKSEIDELRNIFDTNSLNFLIK